MRDKLITESSDVLIIRHSFIVSYKSVSKNKTVLSVFRKSELLNSFPKHCFLLILMYSLQLLSFLLSPQNRF